MTPAPPPPQGRAIAYEPGLPPSAGEGGPKGRKGVMASSSSVRRRSPGTAHSSFRRRPPIRRCAPPSPADGGRHDVWLPRPYASALPEDGGGRARVPLRREVDGTAVHG